MWEGGLLSRSPLVLLCSGTVTGSTAPGMDYWGRREEEERVQWLPSSQSMVWSLGHPLSCRFWAAHAERGLERVVLVGGAGACRVGVEMWLWGQRGRL